MYRVYVLYGVTERDPNELVCEFFPYGTEGYEDMTSFVDDLPGKYDFAVVKGINIEDVEVHGLVFGFGGSNVGR